MYVHLYFRYFLKSAVGIKVQYIQEGGQSVKLLKLNDKLSNVRSALEMNETSSFAKKNRHNGSFAEISREDENKKTLKNIIEKKNKTLFLKRNNVNITIQIDDPPSNHTSVNLNLKDNLSKIREQLERDSEVRMDDTLSFAIKTRNSLSVIAKESEEEKSLEDIIENESSSRTLYLKQNNVNITIQIDDPPSNHTSVNLDLRDSLSKIREQLERNSEIRMNDTISFAIKTSNDTGNSLSVIAKEREEEKILEDIIENESSSRTLYLKSKTDLEFLKNKLKLEYGYSATLEKASKRAFTVNVNEIGTSGVLYVKETIEIDAKEVQIMRKDLLLTADIDVPNFEKLGVLGVSFKNSGTQRSDIETSSNLTVIEYDGSSVRFELQPTLEFIEAVMNVIRSDDLRKLKEVTDEFGQFIPQEVTLGGRAYFNESSVVRKEHEENTNERSVSIGGGPGQVMIKQETSRESTQNNSSKYKSFALFGGKRFDSNSFNETDWIKSLSNFRKWACIKIKDPISIFQPLDENLRRQVLMLIGKKIHYSVTEIFDYKLGEPWKPKEFELNIPENISKIIQNKDADCNLFATIVDTENVKKDIFSCQILWPPNRNPSLIVHCIQKKFRRRDCKLKILWMVVGYDLNFNFNPSDSKPRLKVLKNDFKPSDRQMVETLDLEYDSSALCFGIPVLNKLDSSNNSLVIGHHFFNSEDKKIGIYTFSYCLKNRHHVNLPNFTFYTLVISNYSNYGGVLPFGNKDNLPISDPKYISLYSTRKNTFGPVFLKQKHTGVKIKEISCDQDDCICKNRKLKKSEKDLKYVFFAQKQVI